MEVRSWSSSSVPDKLACLKAAVTIGSEESAALGRSGRFGSEAVQPRHVRRQVHA